MNKERLLKLADFLLTVPKAKFDFNVLAKQAKNGKPMKEAFEAGEERCGTIGCALGWSPIPFPKELFWKPERYYEVDTLSLTVCYTNSQGRTYSGFEMAEQFFDLTENEACFLFNPYASPLDISATAEEVSRQIREFVETDGANFSRFQESL